MVDVSFEVGDKDDLYNGTTDSGTVVEDDGTDVHYDSVHNATIKPFVSIQTRPTNFDVNTILSRLNELPSFLQQKRVMVSFLWRLIWLDGKRTTEFSLLGQNVRYIRNFLCISPELVWEDFNWE